MQFHVPRRLTSRMVSNGLVTGFEHLCAIAVYARVVERRIEPAISFDGLLGHRPDLVSVSDVTGHSTDLMTG